jgi:hypothetical protein
VTQSWDVWRAEMTWMTLYFSVAVWVSIALLHLPRLRSPMLALASALARARQRAAHRCLSKRPATSGRISVAAMFDRLMSRTQMQCGRSVPETTKDQPTFTGWPLWNLVGPEGFEPSTNGLRDRDSLGRTL